MKNLTRSPKFAVQPVEKKFPSFGGVDSEQSSEDGVVLKTE